MGLLARIRPDLLPEPPAPTVAYPARAPQPLVVEPRKPAWLERRDEGKLHARVDYGRDAA